VETRGRATSRSAPVASISHLTIVSVDTRNIAAVSRCDRPRKLERCVARRSAGSAAGASGRPPTAWPGLPARGGRKERMKCPRPSRMPVCGGIEKEIEGATLVSTRHSAPQFPLHPYTHGPMAEGCVRAPFRP
jgi:hypothetical protein